mmetsp:Transcript_4807/g.9045  ORF Transcript_4807/g.9045 Transcript_4807/m.9045 type:complete len:271 (-) Transcript_4807:201-1013(-)
MDASAVTRASARRRSWLLPISSHGCPGSAFSRATTRASATCVSSMQPWAGRTAPKPRPSGSTKERTAPPKESADARAGDTAIAELGLACANEAGVWITSGSDAFIPRVFQASSKLKSSGTGCRKLVMSKGSFSSQLRLVVGAAGEAEPAAARVSSASICTVGAPQRISISSNERVRSTTCFFSSALGNACGDSQCSAATSTPSKFRPSKVKTGAEDWLAPSPPARNCSRRSTLAHSPAAGALLFPPTPCPPSGLWMLAETSSQVSLRSKP